MYIRDYSQCAQFLYDYMSEHFDENDNGSGLVPMIADALAAYDKQQDAITPDHEQLHDQILELNSALGKYNE